MGSDLSGWSTETLQQELESRKAWKVEEEEIAAEQAFYNKIATMSVDEIVAAFKDVQKILRHQLDRYEETFLEDFNFGERFHAQLDTLAWLLDFHPDVVEGIKKDW